MTIDTRTEAERRYDAERNGSLYSKPEPASPERRREIFRLADQIFGLSDEAEPPPPATPAVVLTKKDDDWFEYAVDGVALSIEQGRPACLSAFGTARDLCAERVADLRRLYTLLSDSTVQRWIGMDVRPTPAIELTHSYRDPNNDNDLTHEPVGPLAFTDFSIGADLTKVIIGGYGGEKPGVELIIGGTCINDYLHEVITLADVRTLRDNLTVLLNDERVQGAFSEAANGSS